MARVFVTGGAGFIGSHTINRLVKMDCEVAIYDNYTHYVYPLNPIHIENIERRTEPFLNSAHIYRGSTLDREFLRSSLWDFQPEYVLHLAAMPISKLAAQHPEEAVDAMVKGTLNILETINTLNTVQRFVYISSSMVYGDFERLPMPESGSKSPIDVYGSMKLAGEYLTRAISRKTELDFTIIRPSAVYGPTDNNRRVLDIFIDNALAGKPLKVKGHNRALDFTYVTDIAEGIIGSMFSETASGKAYNITRGKGRTILEAAEIVSKLIPGTKILVEDADRDMPSRGALDISKAKRDFDYQPEIDLEDGLARLYAYKAQQYHRNEFFARAKQNLG